VEESSGGLAVTLNVVGPAPCGQWPARLGIPRPPPVTRQGRGGALRQRLCMREEEGTTRGASSDKPPEARACHAHPSPLRSPSALQDGSTIKD
jgi:hypothetical protein